MQERPAPPAHLSPFEVASLSKEFDDAGGQAVLGVTREEYYELAGKTTSDVAPPGDPMARLAGEQPAGDTAEMATLRAEYAEAGGAAKLHGVSEAEYCRMFSGKGI